MSETTCLEKSTRNTFLPEFQKCRPKNCNCKECVVLWERDELASGVFISKGLVEYRRAYAWRDEVTVRKAM
jgi:hypothetical protein